MINSFQLMARLTRDPEVRQSQSGTYVAKFGVASNERVPDGQGGYREETSFFDCVIFGKRAESFSRFFRKGNLVMIEGKLHQSRWQDRETGQNRSKVELKVFQWHFTGESRDDGQGGQAQGQTWPQAGQNHARDAAISGAMHGGQPPAAPVHHQQQMQPAGYNQPGGAPPPAQQPAAPPPGQPPAQPPNGQPQSFGGGQSVPQPNGASAPDFPSAADFGQGGGSASGGVPDDVPF